VIVILPDALFQEQPTDDLLLFGIFDEQNGRYKVQIRPPYLPRGTTAFHGWLALQSVRAQEQIRDVLARGAKAPQYGMNGGEPTVIVERVPTPIWPRGSTGAPARLPPGVAKDLLARPLHLLLENARNDFGFLNKIVPDSWRARWNRAIEQGWIKPEMGGGISEMLEVIEQKIAGDHARRVRTWIMFDSDGKADGHRSCQSGDILDACVTHCISHHSLERRAIENYIPKATLFDWASRRPDRKSKDEKRACVKAYSDMTPEQRHHYNLKDGFKQDAESNEKIPADMQAKIDALYDSTLKDPRGPLWVGMHKKIAQEVWGEVEGKPYMIPEGALGADDFEPERAQIFQSIFGAL